MTEITVFGFTPWALAFSVLFHCSSGLYSKLVSTHYLLNTRCTYVLPNSFVDTAKCVNHIPNAPSAWNCSAVFPVAGHSPFSRYGL